MLLGLSVLLSGCGGAKDQYFRLSTSGPVPVGSSGLAVGVGPVTLPAYLDRPELVFMSDANQVQIPAKVSWAGTLQDNFVRTLASDVGRELRSGRVVPYPWGTNLKLRYQVTVDVRQFHAVSGGEAVLDVTWRIETPAERQVLGSHSGSFRESVAGDGYAPVVAAESKLVEQLAGAIRRSLPGGR